MDFHASDCSIIYLFYFLTGGNIFTMLYWFLPWVLVFSVSKPCPSLCDFMDWSLPGSSVHRFPRQEYQSGLPFPSPGDLPDPWDQTYIFCIGRQILYHWATRENPQIQINHNYKHIISLLSLPPLPMYQTKCNKCYLGGCESLVHKS